MDEHFNLPSTEEAELYGLVLDFYEGQFMGMPVFDNCSRPLSLSLEEIRDAQRDYETRNPKGLYSIVPIERVKQLAKDRMEKLGITEEDIEQTRYPTYWP